MSLPPSRPNPWQVTSTRQVYKNRWITLQEHQVITPGGSNGIYSVVQTRAGLGALAITADHHVILVGQYRFPLQQYSWEIIEGGAEEGEAPEKGILRELQEEAGISACTLSLLGPDVHLSNCYSNEVAKLYLATDLVFSEAHPEDTEQLQLAKIPLAEAFSLVESGGITDAMSVIALLRYRARLHSK